MSDDMEARLDNLEINHAHQAQTIEDLSQMVAKQWDRIDRLTRQIKYLNEAMLELEENRDGAPANQKPPHY